MINNAQATIEKVNNKLDTHVKDTNSKNEELKRGIQNNIRQQQREHGETINTLKQKIVEVDGRQHSTELKICETDKEKGTRIEELRSHISKIKEGQERLQRQLAEVEVGPNNRVNGQNNNDLKCRTP